MKRLKDDTQPEIMENMKRYTMPDGSELEEKETSQPILWRE